MAFVPPSIADWSQFQSAGTPVLSNAQLRQADCDTAARMPSLLLMEQAAMQCCRYLEACPQPYLILVGPGNNGGDGLALARMLLSRRAEVDLWWAENQWHGDAARNFELLRPLLTQVPPRVFGPHSPPPWARYRCIIDCLFGSGLNRPITGSYAALIHQVNTLSAFRLAIDIPSGLQGDSPALPGCSFAADATLVLGAARLAHLLYPAAARCGLLQIAPIGISQDRIEEAAQRPPGWQLVGSKQLVLPLRQRDSSKNSYGHLLLVGGCAQSSGAIRMAALSALRSGVGLVSMAADAELLPILAADLPDVQLLALPESDSSPLPWPKLERYAALAIGCGWGREKQRGWLLEQLLRRFNGPLLLDADALYALSQSPALLPLLSGRAILTPHLGEFATLLQGQPGSASLNKEQLAQQRPQVALDFARQHQLTLLLRGSDTLLCSANKQKICSQIITRGHDALARGGSGDVLAGLVGGLLAQGQPLERAARLGAWMVGRAAEIAAEQSNRRCLLSSQLPLCFARVFNELENQ